MKDFHAPMSLSCHISIAAFVFEHKRIGTCFILSVNMSLTARCFSPCTPKLCFREVGGFHQTLESRYFVFSFCKKVLAPEGEA